MYACMFMYMYIFMYTCICVYYICMLYTHRPNVRGYSPLFYSRIDLLFPQYNPNPIPEHNSLNWRVNNVLATSLVCVQIFKFPLF